MGERMVCKMSVNWPVILSISLLFCFMAVILYFTEPTTNELVKCYDKYGNEIVGQVCKNNSDWNETELKIGGIFFAIAGLIPVIVGIFLEIKDKGGKRWIY